MTSHYEGAKHEMTRELLFPFENGTETGTFCFLHCHTVLLVCAVGQQVTDLVALQAQHAAVGAQGNVGKRLAHQRSGTGQVGGIPVPLS
jgi:hypothetical protein